MEAYMGIVTNDREVSGIIIDDNNKVIVRERIVFKKNIFRTVRELVSILLDKIDDRGDVVSKVGVTGDYRKIVGNWLGASVCNEIMAMAKGSEIFGDVSVVFDSDGNDIKRVCVDGGSVRDYEIRDLMFNSDILSEFRNFSDKRECDGKVLVTGDIVNDERVISEIKCLYGEDMVDIDSDNIMRAIGIALIGRNSDKDCYISKELLNKRLEVKENSCCECGMGCEGVYVFRGDKIINSWGNECKKGESLSI